MRRLTTVFGRAGLAGLALLLFVTVAVLVNAGPADRRFDGGTVQNGLLSITSGGVSIGASGTTITSSIQGTVTSDIASVSAVTCLDTSVTVTGAAVADICALGLPAAPVANMSFDCYVSAANTVKIRTCNPTAGALDPNSASYSVRLFTP